MSECMTQEDAEKMSNQQAVNILKPLRDMMRDQHGCPISDAYFALDKAIKVLTADVVEIGKPYFYETACKAEWIDDVRENVRGEWTYFVDKEHEAYWAECSICHKQSIMGGNFCPNCGADMRSSTRY